MTSSKFCVFCGKPPAEKNREHVLPRWLLSLTGDPNRVVKFGIDFETMKTIEFSWSSFVVPACSECNRNFSNLESKAQEVVKSLLAYRPIPAKQYLVLLDWLDKVRIGTWIAYHFIQRNPTGISPRLFITNRIATKDRLVAVYAIDTDVKGLNALGVETFLFHRTPSCFGLRINNLLFINMSVDFFVSANCGFPYPKVKQLLVDGPNKGMLYFSDFTLYREVKHPILEKSLFKPSVLLLQPFLQRDPTNHFRSGYLGVQSDFDSFLAEHTYPPYLSPEGVLIRQRPNEVEVLAEEDTVIDFDDISGSEVQTMYGLVSQVYDFQIYIQHLFEPVAIEQARLDSFRETMTEFEECNAKTVDYLRSQPPTPA